MGTGCSLDTEELQPSPLPAGGTRALGLVRKSSRPRDISLLYFALGRSEPGSWRRCSGSGLVWICCLGAACRDPTLTPPTCLCISCGGFRE